MKQNPVLGLGNHMAMMQILTLCMALDSVHISAWGMENSVGYTQLLKLIFRFLKL